VTAFYTVADDRFFVGLVALLNSLRLTGHDDPLLVHDCGLEPRQRELLGQLVELVPAPAVRSPVLLTGRLPLQRPADVVVLVDADVIVTRSLAPLLETAATGSIVAAADRHADRFVPAWSELPGQGQIAPHPYVNNGLVALPGPVAMPLLEQTTYLQERLHIETPTRGGTSRDDPFYYLDQDVLNAVLASERWRSRLVPLEHRLVPFPPFPDLRLLDETTLACGYADVTRPYALHHAGTKPWLTPSRPSVYSRLLTRLVLGDGVALRLDPSELRLQQGLVARAVWRAARRRGRRGAREAAERRVPPRRRGPAA
jgi:hypothetical protein